MVEENTLPWWKDSPLEPLWAEVPVSDVNM
jgi:hypothetical protein